MDLGPVDAGIPSREHETNRFIYHGTSVFSLSHHDAHVISGNSCLSWAVLPFPFWNATELLSLSLFSHYLSIKGANQFRESPFLPRTCGVPSIKTFSILYVHHCWAIQRYMEMTVWGSLNCSTRSLLHHAQLEKVCPHLSSASATGSRAYVSAYLAAPDSGTFPRFHIQNFLTKVNLVNLVGVGGDEVVLEGRQTSWCDWHVNSQVHHSLRTDGAHYLHQLQCNWGTLVTQKHA